MKALRRYLLPASITLAVFALAFLFKPAPAIRNVTSKESARELIELSLPHGRVLYVIVEEKGVYFGEDFVAFEGLEGFIEASIRPLRPDYALVYGTDLARYGHVVQVFAKIKQALCVPTELRTDSLLVGTRRGPIEVHQHHWEYD